MGCLYYIPSRRFEGGRVPDVVKGEALAALGLGHLVGAPVSFRGVRNQGPDGGAGLVVGLRTSASETGVFAGVQHWQPVAGGDVFVGWPKAVPPGPEVFERVDALVAKPELHAKLGDGNLWGFVPSEALPMRLTVDEAGELARRPRVNDAAHYAASQKLFELLGQLSTGRDYEVTLVEAWQLIVDCLSTRYHLDFNTGLALGLFEESLYYGALKAALGVDTSKKNEARTGSDMSPTGAD